MKKTFLAKRNAILSPSGFSVGLIALLVVILMFVLRMLAPNFFLSLSAPLFRLGNVATERTHSILSSFGNTATLTLENENLINQNQILAAKNRALTDTMLNLSVRAGAATISTKGIIAEVVARPPMSVYDVLVVAAGSTDGVTLGMEAFGSNGVPLGVVSTVMSNFARITLFSAPGEKIMVLVGSAHTSLTIFGTGAGTFSAEISRATPITVGEAIYAPGSLTLPIGVISRIDGAPSSPTISLRIMPTVNIFKLSSVTLRKSGASLRGALIHATSTNL